METMTALAHGINHPVPPQSSSIFVSLGIINNNRHHHLHHEHDQQPLESSSQGQLQQQRHMCNHDHKSQQQQLQHHSSTTRQPSTNTTTDKKNLGVTEQEKQKSLKYHPYRRRPTLHRRPYLYTRSKRLNNAQISAIRSREDHRELMTESNTMVQIVPLPCQSHTNQRTNFHTSMNVTFLRHLLSLDEYYLIQLLVDLNRWATVNHKSFDTLFTDLLKPHNDEWNVKQQEFFKYSIEKRRLLLSRDRTNPNLSKLTEEERKWKDYIPQLTKYLEKYQILYLREKFPNVPEENLLIRLNQERNLEKCEESLRNQAQLRLLAQNRMENKVEPLRSMEEEQHHHRNCLICCEETEEFAVFENCEHRHACKKCATQLTICPWCRKSTKKIELTKKDVR